MHPNIKWLYIHWHLSKKNGILSEVGKWWKYFEARKELNKVRELYGL